MGDGGGHGSVGDHVMSASFSSVSILLGVSKTNFFFDGICGKSPGLTTNLLLHFSSNDLFKSRLEDLDFLVREIGFLVRSGIDLWPVKGF